MGNFTISGGFENPRRGRQARNLATKIPKILDLKSSSEQIFSKNCRWMPLTVMITQNVTLSNTKKGKIQKKEQNFNPGLALIGLSGTGPRTITTELDLSQTNLCMLSSLGRIMFVSYEH